MTALFRFKYIFNNLLFILIANVLFVACRTLKPIKPPVAPPETVNQRLDFKTPKALINYLQTNEFKYDWLTSKFSADVITDDNKQSFNVSVRAKKDSAMWLSVSVLGIEGARMLITQDSVRFMDKLNNKYFVGDYQYLSQLLNIDVDFETMQSVLIGNSMEFYDEDDKLKSGKDSTFYLLSTIKKRKLRKALKENTEGPAGKELAQRIWLHPLTFKVYQIVINDFPNDRTFTANYSNFQVIDSAYFPFKAKFLIQAQKKIVLDLDYSKVVHDKPQSMPFNIPAKYERIK
ncbi:MAG TPA: DUF4292 domain-containing protein [Bacteroidia bacterium]|nr:DUF4292 domain-containing protein [Bacteroidia bacterium]